MKSQKVACIGNMNNNMFSLVRYLRDLGYDAELVMMSHEKEHYQPEADTYDDEYKRYTRQLSWGGESNFDATPAEVIAREMEGYNCLIGCNYAPAFLSKAGLSLDIFCPHGSDYYEVPFYTDAQNNPTALAAAQRDGIVNALYILSPATNQIREQYWKRLAPKGKRIFHPIPLLYLPQYDNLAFHQGADSPSERFKAFKAQHKYCIFHHVRHCWNNPEQANDHKGNDILLRGLAEYTRTYGDDFGLVSMEFGPEVEASKELICQLGIEKNVLWLPAMRRKEIMPLLRLADIAAIEFRYSWITGGALFEAMAASLPVMAKRNDVDYPGQKLFPLMEASSSEGVAQRLREFVRHPEEHREMGRGGRAWVRDEVIGKAVDAVHEILQAISR